MACVVKGCIEKTSSKGLMCKKHWSALPQSLRDDVRKGAEKGQQTLKVTPGREWMISASKIVGDLHNLTGWGGDTAKTNRRFESDNSKQTAV